MEAIVDQRITAWYAVWDLLKKHNPDFAQGPGNGTACALREIQRLQEADGRIKQAVAYLEQLS